MRLAEPAVPNGWQVQKNEDGATRVVLPDAGIGACVAVSVSCLIAVGLLQAACSQPGTWAPLVMLLAVVLPVVIASFCLLMRVTSGQTWILSHNRLDISGARLAEYPRTASYHDCTLEIARGESGVWELQLRGDLGLITLHRGHQIEELLALYAFLEQKLGWQETPTEAPPAYFRPVMDRAIRENNSDQLRVLLQDTRALPLLAQVWREARADTRPALLELLTAIEQECGRFSELIERDGCDGQLLAIEVLEALEERRALPALRRLMGEGSNQVRVRAVLALGRMRDAEAVSPLCESLVLHPELWPAAVSALGQIGDPRANPALAALLGLPEAEKVKGLRQEIVLALANLRDPSVIPVLAEALRDPSYRVRAQAAESLGKLGWREAVPALIGALHDSRWQVATKAAAALGSLGEPAGIEPLIRTLAHENPELRVGVVQALGELGGAAALSALCRRFGDPEPRVRREAALAVARLVTTSADVPIEARAALPMLRELWEGASEEGHEIRAACELAMRKIEAATASIKQLPLSVGIQPLEPESLPVPAGRSK